MHLTSERVPLRDLLGELARTAGFVLDLGGREVKGEIELASDGQGLSPSELWRIVNEQLAQNTLAIVQRPGQEALSLVPLGEAAGLARIEPLGVADAHAGYVRVLYRTRSGTPRSLATALLELMPKERTSVVALETAGHVALAGLRADVEQALVALALLDGPAVVLETIEVPVTSVSPTTVATRLEQIIQKQTPTGTRPTGWFFAMPESSSIMVGAPASEIARWRAIVERFDAAGALSTRSYVPRRFAAGDVAALIGDVVGQAGHEPSGWHLVQDNLTGTLIITANEATHERVQDLFDRLEGTEQGSLEELRSFEVCHRDAKEIVERLERLLDLSGRPEALESGPVDAVTPTNSTASPRRTLRLSVDEGTNRILAHAEPRVLRQLEGLVRDLDTLEPQVLIEATVVSLSESQMRALGVELRGGGNARGNLYEVASLFGLGSPALLDASVGPLAGTGAAATVLNPGDFSAVLRALETVSEGRSLARPRLVTRNHVTAELDSVLESPFSATVSTDVVATTTFGGSSEAGTQISVTPHITSGDRLRIEYAVTLSAFVGDPADPALPPPRQQTVLKSEATVPDGFTVVLGGLELESSGKVASRTPLLERLPLLGWLFRDASRSAESTRFYVFLRCDVLRSESFRGLRHVTARATLDAGLPSDVPVLEPRWMR
ncbi:MAG: secretin N-terminal domain-containing protein [Planctomycetota bacterium]